jgi:segregation and condensation protein B
MEELEIHPEPVSPEDDPAPNGPAESPVVPAVSMDDWLDAPRTDSEPDPNPAAAEDARLKAVLEAIVYVTEDPITVAQAAAALGQPPERIKALLDQLVAEFDKPEHGLAVKEVAGGYKVATKAEHHDAVRNFVKSIKPPLKLSLPALETLAVIAYKQPVTAPEIMEIRGVQGTGVLKTLLDRKLIAAAGRKNVIGKPILYKTTKDFMIQFGLKDLSELPSLKEFEEIRRMALSDDEPLLEQSNLPPDDVPLPIEQSELPPDDDPLPIEQSDPPDRAANVRDRSPEEPSPEERSPEEPSPGEQPPPAPPDESPES